MSRAGCWRGGSCRFDPVRGRRNRRLCDCHRNRVWSATGRSGIGWRGAWPQVAFRRYVAPGGSGSTGSGLPPGQADRGIAIAVKGEMRGIGFGAIGPDDVIGHRPGRAVGADSGGPRLPSDVVADFTRRIPIVCIAHHHPQAVDDATANFNDQRGAEFGCAVIGYDNSTIAALPPVGLASNDHAGQIPGGDSNPAFARADRGPDRSQSCAAGVRCF